MGKRVHISPETLRAAWECSRAPDWPPTYDEAMADPLLRGLVRARAIGMTLAQHATPRAAPRTPARRPALLHRVLRQIPLFDRKRAASGDTPDDDDDD